MGLDAFVRCNCFWEGKTSEPPVSRDLVTVNEDGWWDFVPSHDGPGIHHEILDVFDEWSETACAHFHMKLARERVCNWSGKVQFLSALERAGTEKFPILWDKFPEANGGQLSPPNAAQGLMELQFLRESADLDSVIELVEEGSDEVIQTEGLFGLGPGQNFILDEQGLRVVEDKTAKTLFVARRIAQTSLSETSRLWTNLDSGETFETTWQLSIPELWPNGNFQNEAGDFCLRPIATARWRQRPLTSLDLDYIIAPLTRLFEAAIETGNPVVWT